MSAPAPGTPEWAAKVTASKVAGILGLSTFDSQRSTWLKMRGDLPGDSESRAMQRGNMLEDGILNWWLADHPEHTETARQKWYPLDDWAGATPDMDVTSPDGDVELVDAKSLKSDDEWQDGPPPQYLVSSLFQLACNPSAKRVHLAVLFGFPYDLKSFTVERDDDLIAALLTKCREFYDSISGDEPPALTDHPAEYDAVRKTHVGITAKEVVTLDADLADLYLSTQAHAAHEDAIKAQVLEAMGNAQYANHPNGQRVARRQPSHGAVALYCAIPKKALPHPNDQETAA